MALLTPTVQAMAEKELAERKLGYFIRKSWHVIEPATPYMHNWHIDAISDHLEACMKGDIRRLVVTMPPRHMKSTGITVAFPDWAWLQNPSMRFLTASYALPLAIRDARKSRLILESDWFKSQWPHIQLSPDQNAKSRYENTVGGYRLAVSVGSGTTGEGGDGVVVDDPHNARDIDAKKRESTLEWFDTALSTRLNNPKKGFIIVVQQRLHERDLAGHLLHIGGWEHLNLPAEYEGSKYTTCIGFKDPRTTEGQLLWPKRVGPQEITQLKKTLGSMAYAAQFQQRPVPASGGQFKKQHLRYYSLERIGGDEYAILHKTGGSKRVPLSRMQKVITVDLAVTKNTDSDYTVISTWGITPEKEIVLLDVIRDRLDNPEQFATIKHGYYQVQPSYVSIESVAYQLALVQQLRREGLAVREFKPKGDKVSRAVTASVMYEGEQIFHPDKAPWLVECESELLHFPKGEHDDFVDTVSMIAHLVSAAPEPQIRRL